MKLTISPQVLALCTALAWGIGGFFEKKGLIRSEHSTYRSLTSCPG